MNATAHAAGRCAARIVLGAENWGPLEERGEALARAVSATGVLHGRHADGVSAAAIRYRTAPDAEAEPVTRCGDSARLLPVPQGKLVELDITCGLGMAMRLSYAQKQASRAAFRWNKSARLSNRVAIR